MTTTHRTLRWCAALALLVACVGCDQVTKQMAQSQLRDRAPQSYCGNLLRLEYAENPGGFLGLGGQLSSSTRWVVFVLANTLVAIAIAGSLVWRASMSRLEMLALVLILSGALGNLVDRVRFEGLVIDFLNLGIGPLRTGIFNVADMAVMLGTLLLAWRMGGASRTAAIGPTSN